MSGLQVHPYRVEIPLGERRSILSASGFVRGRQRTELRADAPRVGWVQLVRVVGSVQIGTGDALHGARVPVSAGLIFPPPGLPPMDLGQDLFWLEVGGLVPAEVEALVFFEPVPVPP